MTIHLTASTETLYLGNIVFRGDNPVSPSSDLPVQEENKVLEETKPKAELKREEERRRTRIFKKCTRNLSLRLCCGRGKALSIGQSIIRRN